MSTIRYAAMTLGIAATADKETERRFATGGRFKAILQNNKTLKGFGNYQDKELKKMGDALQQSLNVGDDILVVQGDGQMTPISMSSADMQFLESRKFTIREIARFFNIPPSKLMDDTNSNYKSTEMSNIQFYSEALQPIVTEIEREFNAKLVGREGWGEYKFVFDIRAIYALDLDSRAKWNKTRLETGQCSVNDLRREDDIAPVDGGDKVYLSVNFAPLGSEKLEGSMSGIEEEGGQK
jgi:HK97 family phage portal protein